MWLTDRALEAGALDASGTIGGLTVACMSASMQRIAHTGYELPDHQLLDLRALDEVGWNHAPMARLTRLLTVVEVDERTPSPAAQVEDLRQMSLSALHLAVLDDGRRVTLLDDRGWGVHGPPDVWRRTTIEEMQAVARTVVGPDEPYGGRSQVDMEADHWAHLAGILQQHGMPVDVEELRRAPHDVELSQGLLTRITTT